MPRINDDARFRYPSAVVHLYVTHGRRAPPFFFARLEYSVAHQYGGAKLRVACFSVAVTDTLFEVDMSAGFPVGLLDYVHRHFTFTWFGYLDSRPSFWRVLHSPLNVMLQDNE